MWIKFDDNWCWYYDEEYDCMMFDLVNGMLFCLCFVWCMLILDVFVFFGFCVDDVVFYFFFEEKCCDFELLKEQWVELVFNVFIVICFFKLQMLKSWYFIVYIYYWQLSGGDVVCVWLSDIGEQVNLLVVELGDNVVFCLLVQLGFIFVGCVMQLGDVIKIMNDRLQLVQSVVSYSLGQVV